MSGLFRGRLLYAGRLFVGQLFGGQELPTAPQPAPWLATGGAVGGATMSLTEWLERMKRQAAAGVGAAAVAPGVAATAEAPAGPRRSHRQYLQLLMIGNEP